MSGITDPSEEYFKDGGWGWDGSVWRKLALLWGYSDRWVELTSHAAVAAGDAIADTIAVPPGWVYVAQSLVVYHDAVAAKTIYLELHGVPTYCTLVYETGWAPLALNVTLGALVLKEGDFARAIAIAPGAGKFVHLRVWGYKMWVTA